MDAVLKSLPSPDFHANSGKRANSREKAISGPNHGGRDRRGRLLHGYMHKTSNSLCGIKGYASLIANAGLGGEHGSRWARKIIAEVEQLEAIYRSVQDMAFPDPDPARGGDLTTALHSASERAVARHRNLVIGPLPPEGGDLLLPERDLELVLDELLANCAEGDGGDLRRVTVSFALRRSAPDGHRLTLAVVDDGPGLTPGFGAEEAVDPFVTTKEGHLGIGLARVDTIADMNGLAWSLASVPGTGTIVSLEVALPTGVAATSFEGSGT